MMDIYPDVLVFRSIEVLNIYGWMIAKLVDRLSGWLIACVIGHVFV